MSHSFYQNDVGRGWDDEEQHSQFGWMDPFADVRFPRPQRGGTRATIRDPHGYPLSAPEPRRQLWPPIFNHRPRHEDEMNDFHRPPPTRHMSFSQPAFYYQPLWPTNPVIQPYSAIQTVRPLPHGFQPTFQEATTPWERWPPESLSLRRHTLPHLLHPFLAAAVRCPEASSSIWDMLDFPTAEGALTRWTPNGYRMPVRQYQEFEAVVTFPPVRLFIIRFAEGIPALEIPKMEDGREITLMNVLLAIHGHLNGGKDGRGYIPQAALEEFDDELKDITMQNCHLRRRYLYGRSDPRRKKDPPKWIDVLVDSATKFVRLVFEGAVDDVITCHLESAPGKAHHPKW